MHEPRKALLRLHGRGKVLPLVGVDSCEMREGQDEQGITCECQPGRPGLAPCARVQVQPAYAGHENQHGEQEPVDDGQVGARDRDAREVAGNRSGRVQRHRCNTGEGKDERGPGAREAVAHKQIGIDGNGKQGAHNRLGLSGTPMPHSPLDLYAQFRFLNKSIFGYSFTRFKAKYCIMGGYENRQVIKYRDLDDMHKRFYSIGFRVEADDVLDLPESKHEVITCTLDKSTMKTYRELEKDFVTKIGEEQVTVDNALTKLLRLAQFTSGFYQSEADGPVKEIDTNKIDVLIDLLNDIELKEPAVIFCRFRPEIKMLLKRIEKMGRTVGELSGRGNDLKEFKEGSIDTLVVQIRSGGSGIDLTRSKYAFYLSTGYSAGDFAQSTRRILHPGQNRNVTYYHIHAKGTLDVSIYRNIKKRMKLSAEIMNGDVLPDFNKQLLNGVISDMQSNLGMDIEVPFELYENDELMGAVAE